jgi:hypothetical protein
MDSSSEVLTPQHKDLNCWYLNPSYTAAARIVLRPRLGDFKCRNLIVWLLFKAVSRDLVRQDFARLAGPRRLDYRSAWLNSTCRGTIKARGGDEANREIMFMRWQRWLVVAAIPVLMLAGMILVLPRSKQEVVKAPGPEMSPSQRKAPAAAQRKSMPTLARQLDLAGVSEPEFLAAEDADLADSDAVIGLIVDGEPRAYLQKALAGVPNKHVVTDHTEAGEITVTHCDLAECTRVFVERDEGKGGRIRVGGLRPDQTLELLIDGRRYSLSDPKIPLEEFPFTETSWGQWLASYPDTTVYVGQTPL